MTGRHVSATLLLVGIAALVAVYWGTIRGEKQTDAAATRTVQPVAPAALQAQPRNADAQALKASPTHESEARALDDAIRAYEASPVTRLTAFRERLQDFFDEARVRPVQDHEPAARALLTEVEQFAEGGYLTGPEALVLRLSLLHYATTPAEYAAISESLTEQAREQAETLEAERASRPDPRWHRYRAEERRIVEEAAAMNTFPDGTSRQEYLRQRLQALRVEVYAN